MPASLPDDGRTYPSRFDGYDPEPYRREQPTMDTNPLPGIAIDYAFAGTKIDVALHHLDEGLPVGQRIRCELAFKLLQAGVAELHDWMKQKGYSV